jgi:hypothetical protein
MWTVLQPIRACFCLEVNTESSWVDWKWRREWRWTSDATPARSHSFRNLAVNTSGCGAARPSGSTENTNPSGSSIVPHSAANASLSARRDCRAAMVPTSSARGRTLAWVFGCFSMPRRRDDRLVDPDRPLHPVDVGPSDGANLPPPGTRRRGHPDEQPQTPVLARIRCRHDRPNLRDAGSAHRHRLLAVAPLRHLGVSDRVGQRPVAGLLHPRGTGSAAP